MASKWQSLLFSTSEGGVSSAVAPELLPDNQNAWMLNGQNRGGKPATRPPIAHCLDLPEGLIQGGESFSVQDGMIVASIAGRMFRIRVTGDLFSWEEIPLGFVNSPVVKQVWMEQTVETLVIQDGQSNPILYNGSVAERAVSGEVPRGKMMAYGNGRLWVAINANELVAGDIRTGVPGSELLFTEATYLTGGGKLFFPQNLKALAFIPVTGQSDYGALLAASDDETKAVRADITSRDDWGKVPGFVTDILRSVGNSSQWSFSAVNQDLYWRDSNSGIRSIRNALADEAGPGSAPVSREVSRLTDYDSQRQLAFCSSVYHDNRLLMTSSPYLMPNGGVGFKSLIALDFATLSSMQGKSPAAYDGQWSGLNFVKLVSGKFRGQNRAFALVTDRDGNNQLWEFKKAGRADIKSDCGSGLKVQVPIKCLVEYPLRNFGVDKVRKRLERCDLWLSQVDGPLDLKVYWRADNTHKWLLWDEAETCAKTTDASTVTPHVWKNLLPQERPQFKTFTIPESVNQLAEYATSVGFEFQIRIVWTGKCRIHRMMAYATPLDDPDYAIRAGFNKECQENSVEGNQIVYVIPGCPTLYGPPCGQDFGFNYESDVYEHTFQIDNLGNSELILGTITVEGSGFSLVAQPVPSTLERGESTLFTVQFDPSIAGPGIHEGTITIPSNDENSPCIFTMTGTEAIVFEQFDGPFVYPPYLFAPTGGGGTGGDVEGQAFYLTETAEGTNRQKRGTVGVQLHNVSCQWGIGPNPPEGLQQSDWGGSATVNLGTGVVTSDLEVILSRIGFQGAYDNQGPPPGQVITINGDSVGSLFSQLGQNGGLFSVQEVAYSSRPDHYFIEYRSRQDPAGYYAGSFGGPASAIYCAGDAVNITYSNRVTPVNLGLPVARTGDPARSQLISAYNSGTRTFTGNMTRFTASHVADEAQDSIAAMITYQVTPTIGDPYQIFQIQDVEITGPAVELTQFYPVIVDAEVYLYSIEWTYQKINTEDFERFDEGTIILFSESPAWGTIGSTGAPVPNGECWEDFEAYPADSEVTNYFAGYSFADQGVSSMIDRLEASDDFESYTVGEEISLYAQGTGWSGNGGSTPVNYPFAQDDFESYAVGAITTYPFVGPPPNQWANSGTSAVA